jgi:glutamate decarboxylase
MGPFEIMYDGDMSSGIPALCWKIKDGYDTKGYNLFDLADRLRSRGWQVPAYTLPANAQDIPIQRILVRHGVSRDLASLLLEDMQRCLDYFEQHPITTSVTPAEASGFHHN